MAGLLDFLKEPEGQGLLSAAFAGLAGARRGQPLNTLGAAGLAGLTGYAGAQDRQTNELYKNLQMQSLKQQIAERVQRNEWLAKMTGDAPANIENASAALAAGANAPEAQRSIGPTLANAQRLTALEPLSAPSAPGTIKGVPREAFQADFYINGGKNIPEWIYKRNTPDMQVSGGYAYDRNNVQQGFLPQMQITPEGKAVVSRPGAGGSPEISIPAGALDAFGKYKRAEAGNDLVEVVGPNGAKMFVRKSDVLDRAAGISTAQPMQPAQPTAPQGNPVGRFVGDPAQARAAIGQIADPVERARASLALESQLQSGGMLPQSGPYQSTLSTEQQAAQARATAQAQAEGTGAGNRTTEGVKKVDKASEMVSNLQRARTLLSFGPTESAIGAGIDKALGTVGKTTPGGQVASALETLSGWLVNNVPRMEGPQGVYDVKNYETMAGKIGDRTVPIKDRLAALDEVERIQRKYAGQNEAGGAAQPQQQNVVQELPKTASRGARARDLSTGKVMVFDGMRWKPE